MGTPQPAADILRALVEAGHDVAVVVTRADKRRGRSEKPRPTPVAQTASDLRLPLSYKIEDATTVEAEMGIVVAFGRILKPDVLEKLPMVNVHFSLLPRWRGAAPVERAILSGDEETGVCLMAIDEGLDTGDVYECRELRIGADETAAELTARLAKLGAVMLTQALRDGLGPARPQHGEATYAEKIQPEDLHLDWTQSALQLKRVVRLGRAWTTWRGKRLLVLQAEITAPPDTGASPGTLCEDVVATGDGGLRLITVQPQGRRGMPAGDWLRGARPEPGETLGA